MPNDSLLVDIPEGEPHKLKIWRFPTSRKPMTFKSYSLGEISRMIGVARKGNLPFQLEGEEKVLPLGYAKVANLPKVPKPTQADLFGNAV